MQMAMRSLVFFAAASLLAAKEASVDKRLSDAASTFSEIMATPDKAIPNELLEKARCVVIVPGLKKAAFIIGGKFGKGFLTCRSGGGWTGPAAIRVEGGSVGFQIGGSETDVVMLVMNDRGAQKLVSSEFTLGGEGEVAAGPVGRAASAQTDALMRAEILSWSRSRGVFAGVSLQGATLREDKDDNAALYGRPLTSKEIIEGKMAPPAAARTLISMIAKYAGSGG